MSVSLSSPTGSPTVSAQTFYPLGTVRCSGPIVYRSQLARDLACILDVDDNVISWSCMPVCLSNGIQTYRPDFLAERHDTLTLIDASADGHPDWISQSAEAAGYKYETASRFSLPKVRLKNAKDLLRYARYETALSDRIRLLAALDEHGSLTVAECLNAFQETKPIAGLASLVLHRFITMDLDETLIGPETQVRRKRD
ncbi:hypothetical protein J5289_06755 [Rhizobium sp. B230/85]|uniref:hypothetical protein n=1 Tax=unclassified Rhizobium TaxID=2613769 RepID=UPI001AD9A774|nr:MULTISPECIES: hypothetical protein [unclassified Rhizobium]MBO9133574.1 hypothetical protein [Rhizobium sp. B209b/85]QXZ97263.1 hypothetical protein J5289_06755 [Rhizobium sp. B230/85]